VLLSATTASSAFLLFVVEPMIGRFTLPALGGAPAVWTACMLFFQLALLGGYLYAHLLLARLPLRAAIALHAGLLVGSTVVSTGDLDRGINRARWILLTEEPDLPRWLRGLGLSLDKESPETLLWTDDLAPLLPALRALR